MQVDPHYVNGLVSSLDSVSSTQQQLSAELSSGLRVTSLSVDPVEAGEASRLGTEISQDDTFVQTAGTTQGAMQVADSTLGSVVTQLTTALSLAVQGNSGTGNASDLQALSQELGGIRDEVVSLANTSYAGNYVFAGSQGNTQPFTVNTATTPATVTYNGDTQVGSVTTPGGQQIQTAVAGSAVFSTPGANVMAALNNLVADFASGTPSPTAAADIAALTNALGNVSQQRAGLDSNLSRLKSVSSYVQTDEVQATAAQGNLVSADAATVATQLSTSETQSQALTSVIATLEKATNLFSLLQ
jgi:flagellar hook-associated protein 3 FlgL